MPFASKSTSDRYLGAFQLPLSIGRFNLAAMTRAVGYNAICSCQHAGTTPELWRSLLPNRVNRMLEGCHWWASRG